MAWQGNAAPFAAPETVVEQFEAFEHPAAPMTVDLWLDEPGKTAFTTRDKVTLYYRVSGLPQGAKAYLTLLNVAPDGTVAILYPQKSDFSPNVGVKLYLNAEVEPDRVYSIPKTQADLQAGQHVGVDARLRLSAGQEYFKAIVTSEQIDWERLGVEEFQAMFDSVHARGVSVVFADALKEDLVWGAGSLRVNVNE